VLNDGQAVGRIYEDGSASTPPEMRWFWLGRVLINRDCSAIAGCRKRRVRVEAECSGDLVTASRQEEKNTTSQDQAGKSGADDGARNWSWRRSDADALEYEKARDLERKWKTKGVRSDLKSSELPHLRKSSLTGGLKECNEIASK
jgi:hypothetical protein